MLDTGCWMLHSRYDIASVARHLADANSPSSLRSAERRRSKERELEGEGDVGDFNVKIVFLLMEG
jgi:hypothetical protein